MKNLFLIAIFALVISCDSSSSSSGSKSIAVVPVPDITRCEIDGTDLIFDPPTQPYSEFGLACIDEYWIDGYVEHATLIWCCLYWPTNEYADENGRLLWGYSFENDGGGWIMTDKIYGPADCDPTCS